jgi:hypothetical protein
MMIAHVPPAARAGGHVRENDLCWILHPALSLSHDPSEDWNIGISNEDWGRKVAVASSGTMP